MVNLRMVREVMVKLLVCRVVFGEVVCKEFVYGFFCYVEVMG